MTPQLALAGSRVAWTRNGGGNDFETAVFARQAAGKAKARIVFNTAADREERTGTYFGALAAGGSTLAFSTFDTMRRSNDCSSWPRSPPASVEPSASRHVERSPGAECGQVARAACRRAESRSFSAPKRFRPPRSADVSSPSLVRPGSRVEIRNATTGDLISAFPPPGTVQRARPHRLGRRGDRRPRQRNEADRAVQRDHRRAARHDRQHRGRHHAVSRR